MMSFFRRNRERIIVIIIAIILIAIISGTNVERKSITKIEKVIGNVLSPLNRFTSNISYNISDKFTDVKDYFYLKQENELLKKQVLELKDENRKYENIIGQKDYLKDQYELAEKTNYKLTQAKVVGKEPGNYFDVFIIDKGSKDGVKTGGIVIQGVQMDKGLVVEGLVGKVTDVGDNWSKVVTIVDELSSIAFKTLRTQEGGILSGDRNSNLGGYLFDEEANVIKGDKLYTSGIGGTFIENLYIGEVEEITNEDADMMKGLKVNPAINFKKIYDVFILD